MANEESPVQFDATCELGASPSAVFALIADHAALSQWVPGLRRVDVDDSRASTPGGVGTRRTLIPAIGPPGVEVVLAFDPPNFLAYSATDASLRGLYTRHRVEMSCTPTPRGTLFRWVIRGLPSVSWFKRIAAQLMFGLAQRASVRNLQRLFPL
jgi:uncharacterized protein YndB with AHSA1/START domain